MVPTNIGRRTKKINDQVGLAMIHFAIGKCLMSKGEKEEGLNELINSFNINEKLKIKHGIGIVAPMLIQALLDVNQREEAKQFYNRAIAIAPHNGRLLSLRI